MLHPDNTMLAYKSLRISMSHFWMALKASIADAQALDTIQLGVEQQFLALETFSIDRDIAAVGEAVGFFLVIPVAV